MYKESLIQAKEILINVLLQEEKINIVDKVELVMNVTKFLDSYETNINILEKERVKCKEYSRQTLSPQKKTF